MTIETVTVVQAKEMKKDLEVAIMMQIKQYESLTGMKITEAKMIPFQDARFFSVSVWMPPKSTKRGDE